MTTPYLTLESVRHVLPDGRTLFSDLNATIDQRRTGLVGRNGAGKSVLARILAGHLQPSGGHCMRSGSVHYLAQQVSLPDDASVASLAGVRHALDALGRIEAGSSAPQDFDAVGERWDIRQRLHGELERHGLAYLDADMPANRLSGGEAMRIALIGALLSAADFLILDEPSNHLDRPNRLALIDQLQHWPRGLLVISHDRQLLEIMDCILALSPQGLRSHGGNYSHYAEVQAHERENAHRELARSKLERHRDEEAMRQQRERMARKQARGHRQGKDANQAKILLGRQKERSEGSAGKLRQQQAIAQQQLDQRVRDAARHVQDDAAIVLHALPGVGVARRRAAELDGVTLPHVPAATRHISLTVSGQRRIGVVGPNGCGKSTLLKVLAGLLPPLAGTCKTVAGAAYLDQRLGSLASAQSVLAQMQAANRGASDSDLRMRLAQLDLDERKISAPAGLLSGGERLKAALACVLYADPPPALLLLDEPGNHLDLPATEALEAMLRGYPGALVVVSHDDVFLDRLALTDRLLATGQGWRMEHW